MGGQGTEGLTEVFMPEDGQSVPMVPTNHRRAGASAVTSGGSYLSHDAQFLTCVCRLVYVLGGWNGACLNTVERYEPGSGLMHQPGDLLAPATQSFDLTDCRCRSMGECGFNDTAPETVWSRSA